MQLQGKIKYIGQEVAISNTFKKREFVIETEDQYPQFIQMEMIQDKCSQLSNHKIGDGVECHINLRGREYTDKASGQIKYFNTIQCWRIVSISKSDNVTTESKQPESQSSDDMPF